MPGSRRPRARTRSRPRRWARARPEQGTHRVTRGRRSGPAATSWHWPPRRSRPRAPSPRALQPRARPDLAAAALDPYADDRANQQTGYDPHGDDVHVDSSGPRIPDDHDRDRDPAEHARCSREWVEAQIGRRGRPMCGGSARRHRSSSVKGQARRRRVSLARSVDLSVRGRFEYAESLILNSSSPPWVGPK